ncbi:hypothetical protein LINPERPRIM_LOCUS37465, partial [Linum perenne]
MIQIKLGPGNGFSVRGRRIKGKEQQLSYCGEETQKTRGRIWRRKIDEGGRKELRSS